MSVKKALKRLEKGEFVLIHDSSQRENETDMIFAAEKATPEHVAKMRKDAGGLICAAIHPKVAKSINLPYMTDIYRSALSNHEILNSAEANDIPYGERSAFSITVNHRDTFTGITDADRALTVKELGKFSSRAFNGASKEDFGEHFRTPGHVPILRAADSLLEDRKGHTEFSVTLMEMGGTSPTATVCEMLDSETKKALGKEKAKRYAEEKNLVHLEGEEIQAAYCEWKGKREGN